MATEAAQLMFGCVFDGSIPLRDMNIERRPYHKNCKCALHTRKGDCTHAGSQQTIVTFPKREFRKSCSISLSSSSAASQSSCECSSSHRGRESFNKVQVDSSFSIEHCQM